MAFVVDTLLLVRYDTPMMNNEASEIDMETFTIPNDNFETFVKKFQKLAKRANKLGCAPVSFNVLAETMTEKTIWFMKNGWETSRKVMIPAKVVSFTGTAPKLADWTLVAKIEQLEPGINLIQAAPGIEGINVRFRSGDACVCEHCRKSRPRRETFVVRNAKTGEEKQVGRSCLADFTGYVTPENIIKQAEVLFSVSDLGDRGGKEWSGFARAANVVPVLDVLELTSFYIRQLGWTSKTAAMNGSNDRPTVEWVSDHFSFGKVAADAEKYLRKNGGLTQLDTDRALETIEWVKTELANKKDKNEYEHNLVTLALREAIPSKNMSVVASALATALRVKSAAMARKEAFEAAKASTFVGKIDDKLTNIKAKVSFIKMMSGSFGPVTLVKFLAEDGNIFSWFASGDKTYKIGEDVTILTGRVKNFNEYNGIKETMLKNVKTA